MENKKSTETICKTLAISKNIHLSLVPNVPTQVIIELNKIQKEFIWNRSNPKIKHYTLCNKCENDGLKMWIFIKSYQLTMLLDKKIV